MASYQFFYEAQMKQTIKLLIPLNDDVLVGANLSSDISNSNSKEIMAVYTKPVKANFHNDHSNTWRVSDDLNWHSQVIIRSLPPRWLENFIIMVIILLTSAAIHYRAWHSNERSLSEISISQSYTLTLKRN